eukprot:SAG31_NODE_7011_length_1818_cov_1.697499_1_plen_20_part_10
MLYMLKMLLGHKLVDEKKVY